MDYTEYRAVDFIAEESFQNWFFKKDERSVAFWEKWIKNHPESYGEIHKACNFLSAFTNNFHIREEQVPENKKANKWDEIEAEIAAFERETNKDFKMAGKQSFLDKVTKDFFYIPGNWPRLAAAILGILMVTVAGWWWVNYTHKNTYYTQYGETKSIQLPDSSRVTLNANTRLRYKFSAGASQPREIWLDGEAYFEVKRKRNDNQKFIVHTGEVNVEVLGTEFNVNNYRDRTKVVLNEGKIKLSGLPFKKDNALIMQPGQLVEFRENSREIAKKQVNPSVYTAWKEGKLMIDNTSIKTIVQILEDQYGYEVILKDEGLSEHKITSTATIPLENIDVLLQAISELLDITITMEKKQIIFDKKEGSN